MTGWKANGDILTIIGLSIVGAYILFFFLSIASIVFDQGAYISNFYMCLKEEPPGYKKRIVFDFITGLGFSPAYGSPLSDFRLNAILKSGSRNLSKVKMAE